MLFKGFKVLKLLRMVIGVNMEKIDYDLRGGSLSKYEDILRRLINDSNKG